MEFIILAVVLVLAVIYFKSSGRHLDRMSNNYQEDDEKQN